MQAQFTTFLFLYIFPRAELCACQLRHRLSKWLEQEWPAACKDETVCPSGASIVPACW